MIPARSTGPITSHLAAHHITASGLRSLQQHQTLAAVRAYPGLKRQRPSRKARALKVKGLDMGCCSLAPLSGPLRRSSYRRTGRTRPVWGHH